MAIRILFKMLKSVTLIIIVHVQGSIEKKCETNLKIGKF